MSAVQVRNGFKKYGGGKFILQNLNVNVGRGEIYGLLGASGCGKTTLLSCIVGLRELDMGEIIFFDQPRPDNLAQMLGYMPQETALLNLLTIVESLRYFAMIYGMDESEIKKRIDFLTTFLDLRQISNLVHTLSGGQRKRVSLAIAMIHNPRILVLDEPCVGLDPLLRQRIWGYLSDLSRNFGVTIIVSTHYMEGTKHCDTVGLMRGGRLLEEDNQCFCC